MTLRLTQWSAGRKAVLDRTNAMIDSERSLAEGHIETGITLATHAAEQQVGQAQYRQLEAASAAARRIAAGVVTSLCSPLILTLLSSTYSV